MPKATKSKKKNPASATKVARLGKMSLWTPKMFAVLAVFAAFAVVGVHFLNSSKAATPCVQQVIKYSTSYNYCAKYIQNMMDGLYACKTGLCSIAGSTQIYTAPDGYYGSGTKQAVIDFQTAVNHYYRQSRLVADGVVGKNTWGYLCYPPSPWIPSSDYATSEWRQWSTNKYNAGCGYL